MAGYSISVAFVLALPAQPVSADSLALRNLLVVAHCASYFGVFAFAAGATWYFAYVLIRAIGTNSESVSICFCSLQLRLLASDCLLCFQLHARCVFAHSSVAALIRCPNTNR